MASPILKNIRYDEIIVGYTNWWLKTRFRSVFSSGKIVRTVSGTRRSGIESIFDLDLTLKKSCMRCQDLKNYKYWLIAHFFDLGLGWGLYIQYQDTARPTRTFLVVITASRTLWRGICTSRSIIDTCSREISDPHIIESLIFSIRIWHAVNLIDRTDPSGRELSRRTTKSVHKWFLRIKSRSRRFFLISRGSKFIFFKPIHGYSLGIMMFLYDPNGQVLTRRDRRIHSDRSWVQTVKISTGEQIRFHFL